MGTSLIRLLLKFLKLFPLLISYWLGALVGLGIYLFPSQMRLVTDVNLDACYPTCDQNWRRRAARISLIETGKSLTEALYLWRVPVDRIQALVKMTTGETLLDEAITQNRGGDPGGAASWLLGALWSLNRRALSAY
jgi:Kdo2-lipid IVA lauroyltransferase/acyltransferase